jgi:hypothetical protein
MHLPPDVIRQVAADRQGYLHAEAAAQRLATTVPARSRIAETLRRAADRLDAAMSAPCPACALPGRG